MEAHGKSERQEVELKRAKQLIFLAILRYRETPCAVPNCPLHDASLGTALTLGVEAEVAVSNWALAPCWN
jgi:hypothetical protein